MLIFFNFLFTVTLASAAYIADENLVVTLPKGQVQGVEFTNDDNFTYYGFRNIPFAAPPIDNLRFEAPQEASAWEGVIDSTNDSKICITQYYFEETDIESEDCLYVAVYVPTLESEGNLSTLVWIHGGGFLRGNALKSNFGPDFIVEKDVILVYVNYRNGPFGFLSFGDSILPGNYGLKDQQLALQWTYDNIAYFGGDPNKITIFGQSSGAGSVGLHLLSQGSAGLFRGAIMESGNALTSWIIDENPKQTALILTSTTGSSVYANDTQAFKDFMKNQTVEDIMAGVAFTDSNYKWPYLKMFRILLSVRFWPVVEPEDVEGAFLTENPYVLLESGNFTAVPSMIGVCSEESLAFLFNLTSAKAWAYMADLEPTLLIPNDLKPQENEVNQTVHIIQSMYLLEGQTFSSNLSGFANYLTDTAFVVGSLRQAQLTSAYVDTFFYQWGYSGRASTPAYIKGAETVAHGAELAFIFNRTSTYTTYELDLLVQDRAVTLWTNFAKYLDPTPEVSDLLDNVTWPLFDESFTYLNINSTLEVKTYLKHDLYEQWVDIYETYGQRPFVSW